MMKETHSPRCILFVGLALLVGLILGFTAGRMWFAAKASLTMAALEEHENDGERPGRAENELVVRLSTEQISEFGIEIAQAGPGELLVQKVLSGQIVLDPGRVTHIAPRVSGIVVEMRKTLGDSVRRGEVMAVIDSRELADAKAAYLAALERHSLAQANFDREVKLREKNVSSQDDYLRAKQALAEASITLRNSKQNLYSLGFDQDYMTKLPDLPDTSYTKYEILAPFGGIVIGKKTGLGEVVTEASEIYQIADLGTVWAELTVYQKDLVSVRTAQSVVIRADDIDAEVTGTNGTAVCKHFIRMGLCFL